MPWQIPGQGRHGPLQSGQRANVLLLNKDPRDLARYQSILRQLDCNVRSGSSFAECLNCLGREPFDLILLDQISPRFESLDLLEQAVALDSDLRLLVLARPYDCTCQARAIESGAMDYLEAPLSAAEIIALVDMFAPPRHGAPLSSPKWAQRRGKSLPLLLKAPNF